MVFHKYFQYVKLGCVISTVALMACSKPKSESATETPAKTEKASPEQSLEQIYDEKIEIMESEPVRQSDFLRKIADWTPSGVNEFGVTDPSCEVTLLRDQLLTIADSQKARAIKAFVERCQSNWRSPKYSPTGALIHFSSVDYAYEKNRNFTYVKIRLQNGKIVRGILGVKSGLEKRPLIIANCGITCKAGDRASQYMLMQLFDETPFHVLVLGNGTTKQYYEDNGVGGFGGLTAAENVMRLARYFSNPSNPLYSRISSIHAYGISLGSHESLYASILNSNHQKIYGFRPIKSFAASCPVLDYPSTAIKLFSGDLAKLAERGLGDVFKTFETTLKVNPTAVKKGIDSGHPPFLAYSEELYLQNQIATQNKFSSKDAPWSIPAIYDLPTLLESSRIQNYLSQVQDPMFLWASQDDPVVSPLFNTTDLDQTMLESDRDLISPTITETGSHCAVPVSYGWRNASIVFQSNYLARDPEFASRLKTHTVNIDTRQTRKVSEWLDGSQKIKAEWSIKSGESQARLTIQSTRGQLKDSTCSTADAFEKGHCFKSYNISVSLDKFPGFLQKPINDSEAEAITRWLNVQVRAFDENGEDILFSNKAPVKLEYLEL